jgi:hypothetical protein
LGRGYLVENELRVAFTCPVGERAVIRDIVLYNGHASSSGLMVVSLGLPGDAQQIVSETIESLATHHMDLRQALAPGENIYVQALVASASYCITGYRFLDDA